MRAASLGIFTLGVSLTIATQAWCQERQQHYQCYSLIDPAQMKPREVGLQDQFGDSKTAVVKPLFMCNPVSKNNEPIPDKLTHLVCYQIRTGRPVRKKVEVRNQFGSETFSVNTAQLLCVPSQKRIVR